MDEIQRYAVKAFREDGTPTVNPRRYFVLKEKAVELAKDIAGAMTGGWAQLEWLNDKTGFWEFVEVFESQRKPKNPQQAAEDNRAARSMK